MSDSLPEKPIKVKQKVDLEALARAARTDIAEITKPVKFTPEKKEVFLDLLRTNANVSVSARSVGIAPSTVNAHRLRHPEFDAACNEALQEAVDYMEAEVIRRGFQGVRKKIYYQGEEVGEEIQYSDTLALRTLEALAPDKWASRSNVNVKKEVEITVSDTKKKLLNKLGINEEDIIEGEVIQESP